ncbi:hypothetical protein KFE25_010692 [Diacronema lutheri]|uniref:Fatty acid desaturase domain-containing protein n=2 Tax=Diacronema lutheri TaxID=2081491 RepID=A0A8J6C7E5_DIALT|nr:hypothetical protein KFE25_010692 [Diacronema lutheri]
MCTAPKTLAPAGLPAKYRRAAELAGKDAHGVRWEYYINPFPACVARRVRACLCDPRDWPMVVLTCNIVATTGVAAALMYALPVGATSTHLCGLTYVLLTAAIFDARFILCLHYASHRKLWSPAALGPVAAGALNELLPTVLGPLFGIPPGMYFLHHVVMHHVEDNRFPSDLSSTMPYQRDSLLDFAKYWMTYLTATAIYLPLYALAKGRRQLALYAVSLLSGWFCLIAAAWSVSPTAALWTLLVPFVKSSVTLMFGNWSQHIFVEPSRPTDDYVSTYNCLAVLDNRFTFNDGYHIIHHVNARKHWSEMPAAFVDSLAQHEAHGALCFEGLFFFEIGFLVMSGQWRKLARHVVQLTDEPLSEAQLVALLKRRVQKIGHEHVE